jgi:hypothetical protein
MDYALRLYGRVATVTTCAAYTLTLHLCYVISSR